MCSDVFAAEMTRGVRASVDGGSGGATCGSRHCSRSGCSGEASKHPEEVR